MLTSPIHFEIVSELSAILLYTELSLSTTTTRTGTKLNTQVWTPREMREWQFVICLIKGILKEGVRDLTNVKHCLLVNEVVVEETFEECIRVFSLSESTLQYPQPYSGVGRDSHWNIFLMNKESILECEYYLILIYNTNRVKPSHNPVVDR